MNNTKIGEVVSLSKIEPGDVVQIIENEDGYFAVKVIDNDLENINIKNELSN